MFNIEYFVINDHLCVALYNTKITKFNNGVVKYKKNSFISTKGICSTNRHTGTYTEEECDEKTRKYLKKVKENIINLAFNYSKWEYFITLTFDFRNRGEYSHEKAIELLSKWINNQKHQNRQMIYLLVPEFHKSGRLHFHGLIANVPKWKLEEARTREGRLIKKSGLQIYNLVNYKLGFTTISKIQDQEKVSNYISKYATKELITLKHKKRYWYSRNLEKPRIEYDYLFNSLQEHLKDKKLSYYDKFEKLDCSVEVATQLPIIDIMLTSIYYPNNKLISTNIISVYTLYYIYSIKLIFILIKSSYN